MAANNRRIAAVATALISLTSPVWAAPPAAVDPQLLEQLQETIRQQQHQLQQQAEQLQQQSRILETLQKQVLSLTQSAAAQPAPVPQKPAETALKTALPATVVSGNDTIKLAVSGQINRAVNIINDGRSTNLYHVDNNASNSRFRLTGTARIDDDLTLGTRIEIAVAPDVSSQVSQTSQSPGSFFDQRWVEISLASKTFGKLSLGKGDTASNTTAEVDLSRTDLVQYSAIADIAGGMLFSESGGIRRLTTLKVSDAFKNMDGLSRQSRLRYDSPRLLGFSLAGSLVTSQRSDIALFWGGEGYGFKAAGAFAVANPRIDGSGLMYDGSFSTLHSATGLNLTLAGGLQTRDTLKDAANLYAKLGWLANLTRQGYTAFGIDYTRTAHQPSNDDKGYSVGGTVVQAFEKYATELYLQYRVYSLDRRSGAAVSDMSVGTVGARVKF